MRVGGSIKAALPDKVKQHLRLIRQTAVNCESGFYHWRLNSLDKREVFNYERTTASSCVLANGIPKSGTYLLDSILRYLNVWRDIGVHVNKNHYDIIGRNDTGQENYTIISCPVKYSLPKLKNGQYVTAHLPYSEAISNLLAWPLPDRQIRHVLIYRDPRDIILSYLNFVLYVDASQITLKYYKLRKDLLSLPNEKEQISYIIRFYRNFDFLGYAPWLKKTSTLCVKFEDLMKEFFSIGREVIMKYRSVGVSTVHPIKEIGFGLRFKLLFNFLGVDYETLDAKDFKNQVLGKSRTASGRGNTVGKFREVFTKEHYAMLDTPKFRKAVEEFGYKW